MNRLGDLSFRKVLKLTEVTGENKDRPVVRYEILDTDFLNVRSGVYFITQSEIILYLGKFSMLFSNVGCIRRASMFITTSADLFRRRSANMES